MRESHAFFRRLFLSAPDTCGWISIDPFRLYPGSLVQEQANGYAERFGTRFWAPEWWKSWYDGPFLAELVDPRADFGYDERLRETHRLYAPLIAESHARFRSRRSAADRVFQNSLAEQAELLSPRMMAVLARKAEAARHRLASKAPSLRVIGSSASSGAELAFPLGLRVRNEAVRAREMAVRRLLEEGSLRTEALAEAVLQSPFGPDPASVGLRWTVLMLEALAPSIGEHVVDLEADGPFFTDVARRLVRPNARVVARARSWTDAVRLRRQLGRRVEVRTGALAAVLPAAVDACFLGRAIPVIPSIVVERLHPETGRAGLFVGPRFRRQDALVVRPGDGAPSERRLGTAVAPVMVGEHGWVAA
jgi:hypothetical protein